MEAALIMATVTQRAKEKNLDYTWRYDSINLAAGEENTFLAANNLVILVGEPREIEITSDSGLYGQGGVEEHEHTGNITIKNSDSQASKVQLVRVIWKPKQ